MNILIVHNYYKIPGGEDSVVKNDCELLKGMGHRIFLYTRNNNEIDSFGPLGKLLLPLNYIYSFKTAADIRRIIKKKHIDIVMVHNTLSLISPSVYYAAVKCSTPVIQVVHNFRLICPNALLSRNGKVCEECLEKGLKCSLKHRCYHDSFIQTLVCVVSDMLHRKTGIYGRLRYICLTEFNKDKLLIMKQIDPLMVYIKPNSVSAKTELIPYKKRENAFLYAGRLDELKGIKELFEAWKLLEKGKKSDEEVPVLEVCGQGQLNEWCRDFIAENDLKKIVMRGAVDHDTVMERTAAVKGVIILSKLYEGFPMTIAEAFSVHTPVIGTALGNTGDLISDGELPVPVKTPCFTKRGALIDPERMTGSVVETIGSWDKFVYDDQSMESTAKQYSQHECRDIYGKILKEVTG